MALSIGIVGLPNVGKSTLFTALTRKAVGASNYPFCTIEPERGRRAGARRAARPPGRARATRAQVVPAVVEFVDIAGLVRGASEGEGLGNQFLANIRETDAIAEVVRFFADDERHPRRRQGGPDERRRDDHDRARARRPRHRREARCRGSRRTPSATRPREAKLDVVRARARAGSEQGHRARTMEMTRRGARRCCATCTCSR